ncbi:MAG: sarcinarray family MAST domain-containing protein [Euryarchaeota archaeon]|nr:sarcinarray family MAST domain-containing protein [Euryarchaeota archaeon]MBU4339326.1 sarcinarray family MAST domain-containing protein [Euryarchaeota archaeon]MBU4454558.1 sarcinarray family MAST domain-containing protein [Euryarchaeota archaeon]MCG2738561.1 sarcinarray family MAST domain-containing protein [Candidatus Methanoperedenaceae archaeon]
MKKILILLFAIGIISFIQIAGAISTENEYGNVKAWFNGEEATVKGVKLKIGEPADVMVTVTSNISGNVYVKLTNPLVTEPYEVIEGPSIGKRIDNIGVSSGWSKTFTWKIKPNGAWTNGNAPINIFVSFSKNGNQKPIEFTIADPRILDEQYPGSSHAQTTGAAQPSLTGTSSEPQPAPFLEAAGAIAAMLGVWVWKRGNKA